MFAPPRYICHVLRQCKAIASSISRMRVRQRTTQTQPSPHQSKLWYAMDGHKCTDPIRRSVVQAQTNRGSAHYGQTSVPYRAKPENRQTVVQCRYGQTTVPYRSDRQTEVRAITDKPRFRTVTRLKSALTARDLSCTPSGAPLSLFGELLARPFTCTRQ